MNSKIFILIVLIAILLVFIFAIIFFNEAIMRTSRDNPMRIIVSVFNPPKDLFNYLVREKIDLAKAGNRYIYEFSNKYKGKYIVGMLLDNFSKDLYFSQTKEIPEAIMEVRFFNSGDLIFSKIIDGKYGAFLGKDGSGYILFTYLCPEELPIDETMTCKVNIIKGDSAFLKKYGPAQFFIKKTSDK